MMSCIKTVLENTGIICFPSETVYALACMATCESAIEKIYNMKCRNLDMQFSVMVPDISCIDLFSDVTKKQRLLMNYCFPGPTTIVLNLRNNHDFPKRFFKNTIGVRIPSHPLALELLRSIKSPLVATSTNISGCPPAKKHSEIDQKILSCINLTFIEDSLVSGVQSTVLDFTSEAPVILRHGKITKYDIDSALSWKI